MKSIKIARLIQGLSQFDLSIETKIPNYRLSTFENGKAEPTEQELNKLAEALGTKPEILMGNVLEQLFARTIKGEHAGA